MDETSEYEISIRVTFPEKITKILKLEKDCFVAEYGSSYRSDPHITLYLDRYTDRGFLRLKENLKNLQVKPFSISLLAPAIRREESRHRNLYVMDISNKEQLLRLHEKVSEIASRYESPLLRAKTRERLKRQGIHTDGTRASLEALKIPEEIFDPHITLGEIDFDKPQADIAEVQRNLKQLEGEEILVSSITLFFYEKEVGAEKAKLIDEVVLPLSYN